MRTFTSIKKIKLISLFMSITIAVICQSPFTDVTVEAGIVQANNANQALIHTGLDNDAEMNFGSGAAWIDYDNDGHLDLYITNRGTANCMFHNNGDGTFTEEASSLGLQDIEGDGSGVSFADYNNDGWNDLYLCNGHGDRLFRNDNGTTFTDVTAEAGFDPNDDRRTTSSSWGDYDNDGYLDLYISRHLPMTDASPDADTQDQLFYNNGDGTFTDVSSFFADVDLLGSGFIGGWTDFNQDGYLDIIIINDCPLGEDTRPTLVFQNNGGSDPITDWSFTEVSIAIGIDDCRHAMGIAVGDYNRDGWMDIYYSNAGVCIFYENNEGIFTDVTDDLGVGNQGANIYSWGTSFLDHNNDGWQDLFLVSGALSDSSYMPWYPSPNYLYENNGDDTYSDVSAAMEMGDETRGRNGIYGDYDNDGDLDIFILNYDEPVYLRKNNNDNGHHWIKIELEGVQSNRNGIGSRIKLTTPDDVVQYFETRSGSNLGGGDALYAHFGLNTNTSISEIEITWPSGEIQTLTNQGVDQVLTITEPDAPLPISLSSFEVSLIEQEARLYWSTEQEINNDYFLVQRSNDGLGFETIQRIMGAQTSSQLEEYSYIDKEIKKGDNYYRLKQVDTDGRTSYSSIRLLYVPHSGIEISIHPNPVTNKTLNVSIEGKDANSLQLTDLYGNRILSKIISSNSTELDTGSLANGIYFLAIHFENQVLVEKVIISK